MSTSLVQPPYDPQSIIITVGSQNISGFAAGTFVEIDRETNTFEKFVGADGFTTRRKTNNLSGSITITLAAQSPSNNYLSALALADEQTNAGVVQIQVVDELGTTLCSAPNCWIRKPPTVDFSNDFSVREWIFDCDVLNIFAGGSGAAG